MPTANTAADIGSAIATARKAASLSQKALAALAGTTQAMVSEIESGKETARISIVLRVIAALGLVIDIRKPDEAAGRGTAPAKPSALRPANVVFDEPLPDHSIDLDAIVGGKSKVVR